MLESTLHYGVCPALGVHYIETPLPPISEQQRVLDELSTMTDRIDQQRSQVQSAIDKLMEYRTSLITHAVTGKIDVRDFVAPEPSA